ncbi:MAG: efflux RND transporter periplasmic adaptor subunit [Lewinellaceae bacterium]|nr:efflux RND transporter periplasmic adaptor subunit [Lewinellaceae bacterium]
MKKIFRILMFLAVIAISVAGIAWKLADNKKQIEADASAAQVRNTKVLVTTTMPQERQLSNDFTMTGTLRAFRETPIIAETSGRLVQLLVDNGTNVQQGKLIAVLDNELIQNQIDIAKINLEKGERDVSRLSNLAKEGGVSQQQLDDARNGVDNLKSQIKNLQKQLSMTYVKAPFSGVITNKMVEVGSFISPQSKIADLVQTSKLYLQSYVTEEQVIQIRKGQNAKVVLDVMPNKTLTGRVTFIDVKADLSQRFLVELEITNPGELRGGMNGSVTFTGEAPTRALTIPRECIVGSLRDAQVYVVENGKAVLRPVVTGQVDDDIVAIVQGLQAGDQVVKTGQINLTNGAEIIIQ